MSDSKHIALAIGSLLLVLVVGGAILFWPSHRESRQLRNQIEDLQFRIATMEQTTMRVENLSRELAESREKVANKLKIIPETASIADLMRRLSLHVDGHNVADQTFTAGTPIEPLPDTEPTIRAIPVNIEMQATFESIFAVLQTAESMERLTRMRMIRLQSDRERATSEGVPLLLASMGMDVMYETAAREER